MQKTRSGRDFRAVRAKTWSFWPLFGRFLHDLTVARDIYISRQLELTKPFSAIFADFCRFFSHIEDFWIEGGEGRTPHFLSLFQVLQNWLEISQIRKSGVLNPSRVDILSVFDF